MMRAVAVRAFGSRAELLDVPLTEPGAGQVLIRLAAAGMNPFDWKIVDGVLRGSRPHVFPLILGVDGAGTIDRLGPGAHRWRVGDRVYGQLLHDPVGEGTYAEFIRVPETVPMAPAPKTVGFVEAAAVPTAGLMALTLVESLRVQSGQTVLIVGASGGVGSFATQLVAARGAKVIATAAQGSAERMRLLGATETIDPSQGDVEKMVRSSHPAGVDALIDLWSGSDALEKLVSVVRPGGAVASTIGAASEARLAASGRKGGNLSVHPTTELQARFTDLIDSKKVRVPVESTIGLEDAPAAVAEMRAGKARGKTVIRLG